jgi:D-methionine transport system ATP-binding protein
MSAQERTARIRVESVSLVPRLAALETPPLLQDISFEVFPGDRGAIVGTAGAGKTLLLRLLNRLSEPTSGTLFFERQPYPAVPIEQLRQQVVLVAQEPKLLGMTVQQALEYPLRLRRLAEPTIRDRLNEWMERLQIPSEWRDRTEPQLSLGQRQLVAIARALMIQPAVLLLDEPTTALDAARTQQVIHLLGVVAQQQMMTILIATHQLELARQFGNRVLHLEGGRLQQNCPAVDCDWHDLRQQLLRAEKTSEWDT